jgi:hypothetical protein
VVASGNTSKKNRLADWQNGSLHCPFLLMALYFLPEQSVLGDMAIITLYPIFVSSCKWRCDCGNVATVVSLHEYQNIISAIALAAYFPSCLHT